MRNIFSTSDYEQSILAKVVTWAEQEKEIEVLILIGSRVGSGSVDELSDFDISVFTTAVDRYKNDDSWIYNFGEVCVWEPCCLYKNNKEYQTRLVIYKNGLQIDFALFDLDILRELAQKDTLPVDYNLGYKVLIDKNNLTKNLKQPTYEYPYSQKPSKEEFELAIRIFFFEAFKEAKALARNDLWHAKIRDWTTKKYLLKMIEWREKIIHGWNYNTNYHAKQMQSWIDPQIWQALHKIFACFDKKDSIGALIATINLFRDVATEAAHILNYTYPNHVDECINKLIQLSQIKDFKK